MPFSITPIESLWLAGGLIFFSVLALFVAVVCVTKLLAARRQLLDAEDQRVNLITQKRNMTAELEKLNNSSKKNDWVDGLTGLASRQVFEDRLTQAINQSIRYELTCSVMFLNLDHFRVVNDALGLAAGDSILQEVSKRLLACVRKLDTVSRFAGDEFVLFFSQINRAETASYIALRLLDSISRPYKVNDEDVWLTASIGIAVFPTDGESASSLVQAAESAMYQAKTSGRNTYQFFQKEIQTLGKRELILGAGLHNELIFHDFKITYKPELSVKTNQISWLDVNLDWLHPEFGPVNLADFIHLAENSDLVIEIGEWMVRTVVDDLLVWQKKKLPLPNVMFPISLKQLEKMRFVQFISTILKETQLDSEIFIFEIKDTAKVVQKKSVGKMLNMMKHLGVKIAVNGLGADSFSLKQLHQTSVDIFRIDQEIVKNISIDIESKAVAKMIIALAQSLNAEVSAEGVMSINQKLTLQEMGCFNLQGGLFSESISGNQWSQDLINKICNVGNIADVSH